MELSDKVKNDCKKKIDTTMIGALSSIEEIFGDLWNHLGYNKTDEQLEWHSKYEKLRSKILDNGNNQKRKIDEEFEKYKVDWKVYNYEFQVKKRD